MPAARAFQPESSEALKYLSRMPSSFLRSPLMMEQDACIEIETKIKHLLESALKVNPAVINASHSGTPLLGRGIGLDSIETMSLVVAIEEEFKISIDDSDLTVHLFENVGTLANYILHKVTETP
jgi:acyl carrier protein